MGKDFDKWNKAKKSIHAKEDRLFFREGEIWWVNLGMNVGVEIDGKSENFERPVLVVRKFNRQMVWALPMTSRGKDARFYEKFFFETREYFVVLTQIRTVSTKRFLRKIGMMPKIEFERIVEKSKGFIQKDENPLESGLSRRPKP